MQPYMTMDFVRSYPFSGAWRRTAFRGCLALAAAFLLFLFPGTTLNALVIGTGAYLFADGVMMFSFGVTEPRVRVGMFVRGALAVVAGALAVTFSSMTLGALVFALGAWGVFAGCLELMLAYRFRRPPARERLGLETARFVDSGFDAPSLRFVPLIGVRLTVVSPGGVETRYAARRGRLVESLRVAERGEHEAIVRTLSVSDVFGVARVTLRLVDRSGLRAVPHVGGLKSLPTLRSH